MEYRSIQKLVELAEANNDSIWHTILVDQARDMEMSEEEVFAEMSRRLDIMIASVRSGMSPDIRSTSGLTGGDAWKMQQYAAQDSISGTFMAKAMARGIAVAEYNAAMGCIVAAPTAGSCGILPGCLVSMMEDRQIPKEKIVQGMFTAAGFGMVIAQRASIAGAQGGCQAESGSAAAMTAAALVEIMDGTPTQAAHACAIAAKNQLGLACDPVAGLVEIPCIKRNVAGVMIASSSADMALAGIESRIPVDEVIDAMKEIGDLLPTSLKETAQGGLANTPTARKMEEAVFGPNNK